MRLRPDDPEREVAWTEFYGLYAPIISGFARRMGASGAEVEDLVQEVVQSFFSISPEFNYDPRKGSFRGYLKTCVWNKLSQQRRKASREAAAISKLATTDDAAIDEAWNDVWETQKLHRALAIVRERYSGSPDRCRTFLAFEMCTLLDRSTQAVAAELGMSEDSVRQARTRVGRALFETFNHIGLTTG